MKQQKVMILGAGLIGKPMAFDLAEDTNFEVAVADISAAALKVFEGSEIKTFCADLSKKDALKECITPYDYVVNAVPGFMGFQCLKTVIEAGKDVVDIAFYPENPFDLSQLALDRGVCTICDMGVAPGMSHLLSGYAASQLSHIQKLLIYVGGLPVKRSLPWEYKAVFSPSDVIEEYTRPARLIENGLQVVKQALSDAELLEFPSVGTLEAFNSDGLRSLVSTLKADHMAEKTLRYPGHISLIKSLKCSGFFDENTVEINGISVSPLEFTKKILFPHWQLHEGEEDITIMRVLVEGTDLNGTEKSLQWDLFDRYDTAKKVHSVARTTGYAATSALRLIASGTFRQPGIHLPEQIGSSKTVTDFILAQLGQRKVHYQFQIKELSPKPAQ